jgi:hypothetical protein
MMKPLTRCYYDRARLLVTQHGNGEVQVSPNLPYEKKTHDVKNSYSPQATRVMEARSLSTLLK